MFDSTLVLKEASSLLDSSCHFILGTDKEPFCGGECFIFALEDEKSKTRIAIRIPRTSWVSIATEVKYREAIQRENIHGVQGLVGFDLSYRNYLGSPYLALRWVDGTPLVWTAIYPGEPSVRQNIICEVAKVVIDLLAVQETGCSARDWMNTKINRKIKRVNAGTLLDVNIKECEEQRRLIDKYLSNDSDSHPHVLVHGDINGNNIIVNNQRFQSIIDLGQAEMLPLHLAAAYPSFLTHEPTQPDKSIDWTVKDTETMQRDRDFYLSCVRDLAALKGGLVQEYYQILARKDEIQRYWWFVAASQRNIHKAMSDCNWIPPVQYV